MKVIKKILCSGLILILFLHTNYLAVYYSLYKINTEELTASCCEKKVDNCNAHCYLEKKMNGESEKNNQGTSPEMKLKITEFIVTQYSPVINSDKTTSFYTYKKQLYKDAHYSEIEHPPQS